MIIDADTAGLAHHAREWPDKIALIMGDQSLTYAQLDARVNRLARALRRAGVGDAVGRRPCVYRVFGLCE